jgi:hypothetical protein
MKTHENYNTYPECEKCKDLGDCKHPDVADDLMGSVLPPNDCPRPMDIMKETTKKRKAFRIK